MLKKHNNYSSNSFFLYDFSFAEIIDGPANVREEPNGKAILSLYDRIKIACDPLKN